MAKKIRDIKDLAFDPKNARKHSDRNVTTIVSSLKDVGAARSIVIDEDGVVLAGNATLRAALKAGLSKLRVVDADGQEIVAVRRSGLTSDQKTRLAIADNRAAELAEWDTDVLRELAAGGIDLSTFWNEDELVDLIAVESEQALTDPDEVPAERKTDVQRGDLFVLGQHRLLCGDSTSESDVSRLLGDDKPMMMVTDPPYGVDYDPTWRAKIGVNKSKKKMGAVTNDSIADWTPSWRLFPGDVAYVWHAGLKARIVDESLAACGFELRSQIVWAKDRMALSRGDYHWQHEPCWYAVRSGAKGHRTDDRSQTTLWSIPARDDSGHGHGTQKPVECMARPMRNHTIESVYEPFCGSGSTLIAAEMLGRRCFAIEIEPRYVQIAIDRWENFTGKKAVKA